MVLFVQEIDLRVKLLHDLEVLLLIELHCELIIVLAALVELAKTQDFSVSSFNLFGLLADTRFELCILLLQVFEPLPNLMSAFISFAQLEGPLLVGGSPRGLLDALLVLASCVHNSSA